MSYAQINYPNKQLGSCVGTSIKDAGCYVTTEADILTWMGHPIDPPSLNDEYVAKGLFQNGCWLAPDALPKARPDQVALMSVYSPAGPADLAKCDNQADGEYVAIRINYPNGLVTDNPHFLPVFDYKAGQPASSLRVCDSYDGQIKPLNRYGDPATIITAVMRYKKLSAAPPAPPPDPIPAPTPPPAPPPAPLPTPTPTPPTPDPLPPGDPPVPPVPPAPYVPPDVPEPPALAESGLSTSEWKVLVGYVAQAALAGTAALIAKLGWHVSDADLQIIVEIEFTLAIPAVGYILSRGIRKLNK